MMIALLLHEKKQWWKWMIAFTLLVITIFNHPLYSLLVPFVFAWLWISEKIKLKEFSTILLVAVVIIVLHYFMMDGYDTQSLSTAHEKIQIGRASCRERV